MAAWDNVALPAAPRTADYAAPLIDFSPISRLGDDFFRGAKNKSDYDVIQKLKEGLPTGPDGQIDYGKAAQLLAQSGNISAVGQLAQSQALNKPQFTTTGSDVFGNPQYGFADPRTKTVTPANAGNDGASVLAPANSAAANGATGEEFLKTLPPALGSQVKAMVEGRMQPPAGAAQRSPQVQRLLQYAAQYEPNFDLTAWGARFNGMKDYYGGGKSAEMVRSANQTISHVGEMVGSMIGLNNGQFPKINALGNYINTEMGKEGVGSFLTNAHAVSTELSKVFKGANLSDAEVHAWEKSLSADMSPAQQRDAVKKLLSLLNGSLSALEEKRVSSIGPAMAEKKGPLLNSEAQKTLASVDKWVNGEKGITQKTFEHPLVKTRAAPGAQPGGAPALPAGVSAEQALAQARAFIAAGQAKAATAAEKDKAFIAAEKDKAQVIQRLKGWGIDTTGL